MQVSEIPDDALQQFIAGVSHGSSTVNPGAIIGFLRGQFRSDEPEPPFQANGLCHGPVYRSDFVSAMSVQRRRAATGDGPCGGGGGGTPSLAMSALEYGGAKAAERAALASANAEGSRIGTRAALARELSYGPSSAAGSAEGGSRASSRCSSAGTAAMTVESAEAEEM